MDTFCIWTIRLDHGLHYTVTDIGRCLIKEEDRENEKKYTNSVWVVGTEEKNALSEND